MEKIDIVIRVDPEYFEQYDDGLRFEVNINPYCTDIDHNDEIKDNVRKDILKDKETSNPFVSKETSSPFVSKETNRLAPKNAICPYCWN